MTIIRTVLAITLVLVLAGASNAQSQRYTILVKKSERRLTVFDSGKVKQSYRIALGTVPIGAKERQGDRKTPEGDYYICKRNPNSQFYLSLGLSYPNKSDALRGYKAKLISRQQMESISKQIDREVCPSWNTALGGEIFIHGNGSSSDWTWGCIALDDADMRQLFELLPLRTHVRIEP